MTGSFIITLREGLEAALIIGIILSYLNKTGRQRFNRQVYMGVTIAILASILTSYVFEFLLGGFEKHEELFEGFFMLLAVGLLTPMIIWMQKNSKNAKAHLEKQVSSALTGGQVLGLAAVSFLSVYREGVETVLFLEATALNNSSGQTLSGALLGIVTAAILAYLFFKSTARMNLGTFFKVTGLILIFFAAGLTSQGVHELQEAGLLPVFIEHVWNTNAIINEKGLIGSFLQTLAGYNGDPSLLEVISWLLYLITVGRVFLSTSQKNGKSPAKWVK